MKKTLLAILGVLLSFVFVLSACGGNGKPDGGDKEYELPLEDGYRQVTIYYNRAEGYDDCDIYLWYGTVTGRGYALHGCEYGGKVVLNVPENIEEVGFIIRTNCTPGSDSWDGVNKDGTDSDRKIALTGERTVIYTKAGDPNSYTSDDGGKTLTVIKFLSMADMQDATHIKVTLSDGSAVTKDKVKVETW